MEHIKKKLMAIRTMVEERQAAFIAAELAIKAAIEAKRAEFAEARRQNFPRHLELCGATKRIRDVYEAGAKMTPALEAVQRWLKGTQPFLFMLGTHGAGKSVAASYALTLATRTVRTRPGHPLADLEPFDDWDANQGLFLTADELRNASRFTEGKQASLVDLAQTVRVCVLDEIRLGDMKGAGQDRLEAILGIRAGNMLRTVLTSNHTQEELFRMLGPRVRSRAFEVADIYETAAPDMRKQR